MEQFELPLEVTENTTSPEELLTKERLLAMTDEERATLYKEHVGQSPSLSMDAEKIIQGILNPEEENVRLFNENREEDRDDARSHYPGATHRS